MDIEIIDFGLSRLGGRQQTQQHRKAVPMNEVNYLESMLPEG